jgi:hypothetical protein
MSGYTEDEIIRREMLVERGTFLEKPFTPDSLKNAVRLALDERVAESARLPSFAADSGTFHGATS